MNLSFSDCVLLLQVYRCKSKLTGEMCALKLSTKNAQSHREMHNELRILRYECNFHLCLSLSLASFVSS